MLETCFLVSDTEDSSVSTRCVALPRSRLAEHAFSALVFGVIASTHSFRGFGTMSLSLTKLLQVHNWESKLLFSTKRN